MALLHAIAVWRYGGPFWGDHGRWLFLVSRFVSGDVPYRDFAFTNPPLALWVVGGLAHIFGTSYGALSAIMCFFYLLNFAVFVLALRRLVPDIVLPIAAPALLFSVALACRHGVPLPAGTDSPAGPIGFLCLQLAAWLVLETVESPMPGRSAATGLFLALTILSKHDFWPPAILLALADVVILARRGAPSRIIAAAIVAFLATLAAGIGLIVARAGIGPVVAMLSGSGRALEIALRATPSLERMTAEVASTSALILTAVTALWLCLAISDRTAARWAGAMVLTFLASAAVHSGMTVAIGRDLLLNGRPAAPTMAQTALITGFSEGRSLLGTSLAFFDTRLLAHLLPSILPPILLIAVVMGWNVWHDQELRARVAILLALAIAARVRRGFEGSDWYNVLLELPAYAVFVQLICGAAEQKAARAVRATQTVLLVLAAYSYVSLAIGPMTMNGRRRAVATHAGVARWGFEEARSYHYADSVLTRLDPGGRRSVYALGATSGWNYFLRRPDPLPFSEGLPYNLTSGQLSDATQQLLRSRGFLIENREALRRLLGVASLMTWEPQTEMSRYERRDKPWFDSVARACRPADPALDTTATIRIYDCSKEPSM